MASLWCPGCEPPCAGTARPNIRELLLARGATGQGDTVCLSHLELPEAHGVGEGWGRWEPWWEHCLQSWVPLGMMSDSRVLAASANKVGLRRRGLRTAPGPRGEYPAWRPASICVSRSWGRGTLGAEPGSAQKKEAAIVCVCVGGEIQGTEMRSLRKPTQVVFGQRARIIQCRKGRVFNDGGRKIRYLCGTSSQSSHRL